MNSINKPRVAYLLMCDAHSFTGGKPTFYGVFSRVNARAFPCQHLKMTLAGELFGPAGEEFNFKIVFQDSEGNDVIPPSPPGRGRFSDYGSFNLVMEIEGLPLPHAGIYSFKILHDGAVIGERLLFALLTQREEE